MGGCATSERSRRGRLILRGIALVLSAVVIIGLVRALQRDGPAALEAWRAANVRWTLVTLAAACGLAGQAVYAFGWWRFLKDCGVPISFGLTAKLFLVSNLGRYLPGAKAWQMGIVGLMSAQNGLPAALLAASSLFQGMVGVAVGAILLFGTGSAVLKVAPIWFVLPVAGIIGLLVLPALFASLPRGRALILQRLPGIESVTPATMWALVWTAALSWILWGIALYVLAAGLLADPAATLVTYIAAWIGPFLAGVLAMVAPAGLGVRDELMRTILSSAGVPAGSAIIVALVARVWATLLEVVPAVLVLAMARWRGVVVSSREEITDAKVRP